MIPRLTLPDAVSSALKGIDLKDPNALSDKEYDAYSGAAILGTLIFFLLPGAAFNGIEIPDVLFDFAFSALTGGGIGAYAALRKDEIGEKANQFGGFLSALGDIPRITLPSAITGALEGIDLKSPNDLSTADYNSYSGAAILGTLLFFVLPGAAISDVEPLALVFDFVFSALTGGGAAAYAALRSDDIGEKAREIGGKVASVFPAGEKPKVAEAAPEVVKEEPKVVEAAPEVVKEEPKVVDAAPEVVEEKPKVVEAAPEVVAEKPKVAKKTVGAVVPQLIEEASKKPSVASWYDSGKRLTSEKKAKVADTSVKAAAAPTSQQQKSKVPTAPATRKKKQSPNSWSSILVRQWYTVD
jgi:outer membrane biosynthesis protein TonB